MYTCTSTLSLCCYATGNATNYIKTKDCELTFSSSVYCCVAETLETVVSIPLELLASNAGKRLWMTEYAGGSFNVSDIQTGLALSTQVELTSIQQALKMKCHVGHCVEEDC